MMTLQVSRVLASDWAHSLPYLPPRKGPYSRLRYLMAELTAPFSVHRQTT